MRQSLEESEGDEIKQQKEIRTYLQETFGKERGEELYKQQASLLNMLIERIKGKSARQRKTLIQTILPRIAMYQILQKAGLPEEEVKAYMRGYIMHVVGAKKHALMVSMERIPRFYFLYSRIFLQVVRGSDLWESVQRHDRDSFDVTMKQCLWHTACVENGCPELCPLFCDVDYATTYGGLRKLGFSRTTTLGYGGNCCDFHFYRK